MEDYNFDDLENYDLHCLNYNPHRLENGRLAEPSPRWSVKMEANNSESDLGNSGTKPNYYDRTAERSNSERSHSVSNSGHSGRSHSESKAEHPENGHSDSKTGHAEMGVGYFGQVSDHSDKESRQLSIMPRPASTEATIALFDDIGEHFEMVIMIALSAKLGQHFEVSMVGHPHPQQRLHLHPQLHPQPQQHPLLEVPGSNLIRKTKRVAY